MAAACSAGLDTGFATLDFGQIVVLGLVQGVTELLPISSTAHMRVVPALLGWRYPGSAFSALMQLAALAAVMSYFRRDIGNMVGGALDGLRTRQFTMGSLGYALTMTREAATRRATLGTVMKELLPFIVAQAGVTAAVICWPALTHGGRSPAAAAAAPSDAEVARRLREIAPPSDLLEIGPPKF